MQQELTKSERRKIRQLADLAWERKLRTELHKLAAAISDMDGGKVTPFDVNERVHRFHNGVSRELFSMYSSSEPWPAVYRAYFEGVLTDSDLTDAGEKIRKGIRQFAIEFAKIHELELPPSLREPWLRSQQ